jgi:hypothetical protein
MTSEVLITHHPLANLEEITRKNLTKRAKGDEDIKLEDIENDEVYYRHNSYYEYDLKGVVVHIGSADSGHYYSYINKIRGGNDNVAEYNPNNETHFNSWLEYNDSHISKFSVNTIEDECFGGSWDTEEKGGMMDAWNWRGGEKTKSAYMLVYERRVKNPIKLMASEPSEKEKETKNIVSFKEEEIQIINKKYDLLRYYNTPEYNKVRDELYNTIFYNSHTNEYYKYIPFYQKERLIPKKHFLEILEDNSIFQKHQTISDEHFVQFFDEVINVLDSTVSNLKEIKEETSIKIAVTFMNFIFNILSQKDKQKLLKSAIDKFLHIVKLSPICLEHVWAFISENLKQLIDLLGLDRRILHSSIETEVSGTARLSTISNI